MPPTPDQQRQRDLSVTGQGQPGVEHLGAGDEGEEAEAEAAVRVGEVRAQHGGTPKRSTERQRYEDDVADRREPQQPGGKRARPWSRIPIETMPVPITNAK